MSEIEPPAPRRGEIYWADFPNPPESQGSEQRGPRPAVVISIDSFNKTMDVVVVAAITSAVRPSRICVHLPAGMPLEREGMIMPFQVYTFARDRLREFIGVLSDEQVEELNAKLRLCWGLDDA